MEFRISDTLSDSLNKLTADEQAAVKTTAFDLQIDPSNPGMSFHKLEKVKDKKFCSVRVNRDIRIIVHKSSKSLLLCYVDHHDKAYAWAQRRKIERHPKTGAMQIVEIREKVVEIEIPKYYQAEVPAPPKPLLFKETSRQDLLSYGVPEEWIADVKLADEDSILEIAEHLPEEASEALLNIATGSVPVKPELVGEGQDPFAHPDSQRRFRVISNINEFKKALEYPWEKWVVFLNPSQRKIVESSFNGPARVAGSAGTGKTVVALHRAVYLAKKHKDAQVMITTFSIILARMLREKLKLLLIEKSDIKSRISVRSINEVGIDVYRNAYGEPRMITASMLKAVLREASGSVKSHPFSLQFLETEWNSVVDAWQITNCEDYKSVPRLGRKIRLSQNQREILWSIFTIVRSRLAKEGLFTMSMVFSDATEWVKRQKVIPADYVVIDEAQDISVPQLRFLAATGAHKTDGLFFAGDLGQRIFQAPFSWKSLGVDIRGRSHILRTNYRTSHQIRKQADKLLDPEIADVDGNNESRIGTVSVFNGPEPIVEIAKSIEEESDIITKWTMERAKKGVKPGEIGIFVRSDTELVRARKAIEKTGIKSVEINGASELSPEAICLCTMHLAKGLEFKAVVVAACDDEIIPRQSRIESVTEESDLEEAYNTERHLLYVACTRARENLLITGVEPVSEFLDDLNCQ